MSSKTIFLNNPNDLVNINGRLYTVEELDAKTKAYEALEKVFGDDL